MCRVGGPPPRRLRSTTQWRLPLCGPTSKCVAVQASAIGADREAAAACLHLERETSERGGDDASPTTARVRKWASTRSEVRSSMRRAPALLFPARLRRASPRSAPGSSSGPFAVMMTGSSSSPSLPRFTPEMGRRTEGGAGRCGPSAAACGPVATIGRRRWPVRMGKEEEEKERYYHEKEVVGWWATAGVGEGRFCLREGERISRLRDGRGGTAKCRSSCSSY